MQAFESVQRTLHTDRASGINKLTSIIETNEAGLREFATIRLLQDSDELAVNAIDHLLKSDIGSKVRYRILDGISRTKHSRYNEWLERHFNDSDAEVRMLAIRRYDFRIGNRKTWMSHLEKLVKDPNEFVRIRASEKLLELHNNGKSRASCVSGCNIIDAAKNEVRSRNCKDRLAGFGIVAVPATTLGVLIGSEYYVKGRMQKEKLGKHLAFLEGLKIDKSWLTRPKDAGEIDASQVSTISTLLKERELRSDLHVFIRWNNIVSGLHLAKTLESHGLASWILTVGMEEAAKATWESVEPSYTFCLDEIIKKKIQDPKFQGTYLDIYDSIVREIRNIDP